MDNKCPKFKNTNYTVSCDSNGNAAIPRDIINPDYDTIITTYEFDKIITWYLDLDQSDNKLYFVVHCTDTAGNPVSYATVYIAYV